MTTPLLSISKLTKHFPVRGGIFLRSIGAVHAVDNVSLEIYPGETLGLVGESGCGKSTLGKTLMQLLGQYEGSIKFNGKDLSTLDKQGKRELRQDVQMIFQDPMASLNPRHTIGQIIEEPLVINNYGDAIKRQKRVEELLQRVGLGRDSIQRYPHEFSGGQRQRIGIARALALKPKLIVCDEAVSALDVSIQSQILNLLLDLQQDLGLALLFISHDLSVVRHISDRIAVMYLGEIVETGPTSEVYAKPLHPYTQALIEAIPQPIPGRKVHRQVLSGDVPSAINPPKGCRFHPRCPHADRLCSEQTVQLAPASDNHRIACHHWKDL
ncbi:MAG: oligopeptide/dipeptide ABC transporter ATP-binding protein [Pseudomonadales bacterium]